MVTTKYYVYKRNDGYVFAVTYPCRDYKHSDGIGYTSFELLGKFDEWSSEAVDIVNKHRKLSPYHSND